VIVTGRVQGVFFRSTCAANARRLGVDGWVRNLSDGRVEAVFEGSGPQVDRMVAWCRQGPEFARVDDVDVHEEAQVGDAGFAVL